MFLDWRDKPNSVADDYLSGPAVTSQAQAALPVPTDVGTGHGLAPK